MVDIPYIPDDVLARILNVSDQRAKTSALSVDKQFNRVASTYDIWTDVTFREFGPSERRFVESRNVQKLVLECPCRVFSDACMPHLETLELHLDTTHEMPALTLTHVRHLKIVVRNDLDNTDTFPVFHVPCTRSLETFEFIEYPSTPCVEVWFDSLDFPRLTMVCIAARSSNFMDGATLASVPNLKDMTMHLEYESFEHVDIDHTFDSLDLRISDTVDRDTLARVLHQIRATTCTLRIDGLMNIETPLRVEHLVIHFACVECDVDVWYDALCHAKTVVFSGDPHAIRSWIVNVHGTTTKTLGDMISKMTSVDDVIFHFLNVTT